MIPRLHPRSLITLLFLERTNLKVRVKKRKKENSQIRKGSRLLNATDQQQRIA